MKNHIILSSILFVAVALFHGIRAWAALPLSIGGTTISLSVSWVLTILLLFLAASGIYRVQNK